jgi:hypothetical protein
VSLDALIRETEARVRAVRDELARDEAALERELARAERAERNVERWWFGASRLQRLVAFARWVVHH